MSKEKEINVSKKEKFKAFFTIKNTILSFIVVVFIVQYIQMQSILGTFSFLQGRDSSLIDEIGQLKNTYSSVGVDLNEVRDFLRMPKKNYDATQDTITGENNDTNTNQLQLAFFKYVDYLASTKKIEENLALYKPILQGLKDSTTLNQFLSDQNLSLSDISEDDSSFTLHIVGPKLEDLAMYFYSKDEGVLYFKTSVVKESVKEKSLVAVEKALKDYLLKNKDDLLDTLTKIKNSKMQIDKAIVAPEILVLTENKGLKLSSDAVEQNLKITYSIYNRNDELTAEIILDTKTGTISLVDKNNMKVSLEVTDIGKSLIPFLQKLDTRTYIEKKVDEALKNIQSTIADKGFKLLLSSSGMKISGSAREDDERYYFDVFKSDGTKLSSIALEKATGVVNIVQPDGTNSQNLMFFDPEFKKKL